MSDLISREHLHERINETVNEGLIFSGMTIAEFIEALIDAEPSAERVGHWIKTKDGYYVCSLCKSEPHCCKGNYCMDCGARMEGEEE